MWLPSVTKEKARAKRSEVGEKEISASPRKAKERELIAPSSDELGSHAFARQVLRSVLVGQIIIDKSHLIVNANRAAELLLSPYGKSGLIGQPCSSLFPKDIYLKIVESAGRSKRISYTLKPFNNPSIPVDLSTSRLSLNGEEYTHILITALSEKFGLLSSLVQTQRLANIGTLTTSIIHELTNPMSAVATASATLLQYIENGHEDPERMRKLAESVQRNTDRCRTVIDVIRQHIHTTPARELGHVGDLIQNALALINNRSRKRHNLEIILDYQTEELPLLRCNPNQITQIILNLILNAEDALGSTGGLITITAKMIPSLNAIGVFVEDNGPGIRPEIITEIFEPFFTTKPQGIGMGMGLYISSEIAKIHNGWLKAETVYKDDGSPKGAKFSLVLPLNN